MTNPADPPSTPSTAPAPPASTLATIAGAAGIVLGMALIAGLAWRFMGAPPATPAPVDPAAVASLQSLTVPRSEAELRVASRDPAWIAQGDRLFHSMCQTCHGAHGEGGQGSNLRDDHWLSEPTMLGIISTIHEGRPDTAMQPMKSWYSEAEIIALAAYIVSLQHDGQTIAPGYAPQGQPATLDW